ncbi:MAG: formylglycine-generating enzyme family protein [Methylococcales bacterium]
MPQSNSTPLEQLLTALPPFINRLQREGFNIGVDSYGDVHNLLLTLVAEGQLPDDFSQLRPLIAPVLCCSEQEQERFKHYFSDWLQVLQPQTPTSPIVTELKKLEQEHKTTKRSFIVLGVLVFLLVGLWSTPYGTYLGELISVQLFEKYHPQPDDSIFVIPKPDTPKAEPVKPQQIQINDPLITIEIPKPTFSNLDKVKLALSACIAVLFLMLLWYLVRYKRLQRFLKRHQAEQPPDMETFFLNNQQQNLYSSVAFARTAQQLHKHREIDAHFLAVESTVKRSIQQNGFYTPVYQAIKALPEYLVLIDKAHLNDQLSQFVDTLLKQLDDFGLFIEKYYFDTDPRRCYSPRQPNKLHRLESLQGLYANHRLIIFSEARHFVDPINGKLYRWLDQLHDWQNPFLFTLDSANHWDYYQQQLHEAGFVVLAAGQKGLEDLVSYISADITAIENNPETEADDYPILLRQSPRQFLERHAPDTETINDLVQQLADYLQPEGFNWLAACAVYPELHWQLTLYLGKNDAQKTLNEALLLRLARLPWLRFAYMPDWLREVLLSRLTQKEERTIRQHLETLLLKGITEPKGSADDFSLSVAKNSPLLAVMRDVLSVWHKKSSFNDTMQDYVFQSFMAERLAVKLPKLLNQRWLRFGLLEKIRLLLLLITLSATALIGVYVNQPEPVAPLPATEDTPKSTLPLPAMVSITGGCFQMGSPETEAERSDDEQQHKVCVDDFQLGQTEVTQQLWQAVMGNNPSSFKGDDLPVDSVSWNDAQAFLKKLNQLTGKNYRLPTEAEWEYAARAGTTTPFSFGDNITPEQVNYNGNYPYNNAKKGLSREKTVAVKSLPPNDWGLYEMHGNVYEWCNDWYGDYPSEAVTNPKGATDGTSRVLRGGSWFYFARFTRSAFRSPYSPVNRNLDFGFRFALGQQAKPERAAASAQARAVASRSSDSASQSGSQPAQTITVSIPKMVAIKGGCFQMGSPKTEVERQDDEKQHKVCVDDFQLGQYEITIEQYRQCVTDGGCKEPEWLEKGSEFNINTGSTKDHYAEAAMSLANKDNPITGVSWQDAMAYTQWLSNKTSKNYRLPTEAEWEYAARAGTTTPFYTGNCINTKQANFDGTQPYDNCAKGEYKKQTVKVGSYPANPWGLYDMVGNVSEWTCSDDAENYDGSETRCSTNSSTSRITRGGSWDNGAGFTRSASRGSLTPDNRNLDFGFRFALGQSVK